MQLLSALCSDLTAALDAQHKQQQQQPPTADAESQECLLLLSSAVLQLLQTTFEAAPPAQLWSEPGLGAATAPAIKLAVAHLLASHHSTAAPLAAAAAAATTATTSSSSSDRFDAWLDLWREDAAVGQEPIALTGVLLMCTVFGAHSSGTQAVSDVVMPEMQQLTCIYAAARAQHLHNLAHGKSPSVKFESSSSSSDSTGSSTTSSSTTNTAAGDSHQSCPGCSSCSSSSSKPSSSAEHLLSAVPPWHEELYTACGLPATGVDLTPVFVRRDESFPSLPVMNVLGLMLDLDQPGFWEPYMTNTQRLMKLETGELLEVQAKAQEQLDQQEGQGHTHGAWAGLLQQPTLRCAVVRVLAETLLLFPKQKPGILSLRVMAHMVTKVSRTLGRMARRARTWVQAWALTV